MLQLSGLQIKKLLKYLHIFKTLIKNKHIIILRLFLLFWSYWSFAQNRSIDSALADIQSKKADTIYLFHLNEVCINYILNNQHDSAIKYIETGITYGKEHNFHKHLASSYNILANCYYFKGLYPEAITNYLNALKLFELIQSKTRIANTYNNIGNTLHRQKRFEEALDYHKKALKMRQELMDSANMAISFNNIGNIYHSFKKYSEALNNHFAALTIKWRQNDTAQMIISYSNIGDVYASLLQLDSAVKYLNLALHLNNLSSKNLEDEEIAYINLSRAYYNSNKYSLAEQFGKKALLLSSQIGDSETKLEAFDLMSKIYESLGDFKSSLNYHRQYVWFKDSLFSAENLNKTFAEQYQYKYEKQLNEEKLEQAKKEAELQAEKKTQKQILLLVVGILLIAIIFSVFLFRSNVQKQKANIKVTAQSKLLQEKQKEVIDSINYAKRIQDAILPDEQKIEAAFHQAFIYFKPKDIVSGDLYWFAQVTTTTNNPLKLTVIAVADCTGHGVPGAFMSLLAMELLNQSIKNPHINSPAELLNHMNQRISEDLNKNKKGKINDGLDIAVCAIDEATNIMYFAGANRPVLVIRNNTIEEIKPTKSSIGGFSSSDQTFNDFQFQLQKGDKLYLFTDGITDQFGGTNNKKFTKKQLTTFLLSTNHLSLNEQHVSFTKLMDDWKGVNEQTDDMLLMGVEV